MMRRDETTRCPYFRPAAAVCAASPSSRIPPKPVRTNCCAGGDPEACPTFLAWLLACAGETRRLSRH